MSKPSRPSGEEGHPALEPSGQLASPAPPGLPRRLPAHGSTRSKQVVRTPRWLVDSVEKTWGEIAVDVAASEDNAVTDVFYTEADDGLDLPWLLAPGFIAWCNPPFDNIGAWVKHAAEQRDEIESVLLVLASVGSNWWAEHIHGKAEVIFLRPRIRFVGETNPFPRDLALVHLGPNVVPAYYTTTLVPGFAQVIRMDCVAGGLVADPRPVSRR